MTATEPEEDFAAPASPLQAGSRLLPRLGVLAAAVLWGTTGTAQYYGPAGTDPVAVGYLRLTTGAVTLLLAVLARPGALAAFRDCFRSGRLRWTAIASVAVAGYQIAFFEGVHHTGVAMGTLLALGSAPVFTGLFAFWLMRERFEPLAGRDAAGGGRLHLHSAPGPLLRVRGRHARRAPHADRRVLLRPLHGHAEAPDR